jgi:hypothetical protein
MTPAGSGLTSATHVCAGSGADATLFSAAAIVTEPIAKAERLATPLHLQSAAGPLTCSRTWQCGNGRLNEAI